MRSSWMAKDVDAIVSLFAKDCEYCEDPLQNVGVGTSFIRSCWQEIASQKIKVLSMRLFAFDGLHAAVHWRLELETDTGPVIYDGAYFISFNSDYKCQQFRQWWVSKE